jgi:hypothetical protein
MRISCGENDCLKDDSIRFLNKALRSGHQDVKLKIYKYLLHGYLNWDVLLAMPATK